MSANSNSSEGTGWLDLLRALLWPAVVLIGFYFFAGPVEKILQAVPAILKNAQTVDFGTFKISLSRSALPQPSKAVSEAIEKLDKSTLELILSTSSDTRMCDPDLIKYPGMKDQRNRLEPLIKIGLATHTDDTSCSGSGYAKLNEIGIEVRAFFIRLISAQFEKSTD